MPGPINISLVIPVFNEEGNIFKLYFSLEKALVKLGKRYEIIFVNDGSTDGGAAIIDKICSLDKAVKGIAFDRNYGQDAALAAGLREAVGEVIITMDGDLQDDPNEIEQFLAQIRKGYDVVCGWRKKRSERSLIRKSITFLGNKLAVIIFGLPLHDFNATFKAYRRSSIKEIYFFQGFHRFIPVLASAANLRVGELVIGNNPRYSGFSKYSHFGLRRIFTVPRDALLLKCCICFAGNKWFRVIPEVRYNISNKAYQG